MKVGCTRKFDELYFIKFTLKKMVSPRRFERPTLGLGIQRSIQLSYGDTLPTVYTIRALPPRQALGQPLFILDQGLHINYHIRFIDDLLA